MPPELADRYWRSGFWSTQTCIDVVARRAETHGDRIMLTDAKREITYRSLLDEVKRTAEVFAAHGMRAGDVVTIQLPNAIEFAVAFFAVQYLGAVGSQIGVDFRTREVEPILQLCESRFYICPKSYKSFDYVDMVRQMAPRAPVLHGIFQLGGHSTITAIEVRPNKRSEPGPAAPVDANDVTRMAFTSGTTGNPKAILLSHNSILALCRICNLDMGVDEKEVFLIYLPLGLTWGYDTLMQTVLAGARAVLMDGFDARKALQVIEKERVTFIFTAPASIVSMLNVPDCKKFDTSSLRILGTGGAACPIEVIREARAFFGGSLCEFYGMAEVGYISYTRATDDPELVTGTVGTIASAMSFRLIDENGNDVPDGEPGEIASEGPSINLGYYRNPDATNASFVSGGWFRTGDIGQFDSRGLMKIVGRVKEIINRGGKKFFPREVEEILYSHPKILHAAIVGVPDKRLGERNCLCVVPQQGQTISLEEMVNHLRDQVAIYKLPEMLEVFDDLPLTPSGKVQRPALLQLVMARTSGR